MSGAKDLIGQRFGRLEVIEKSNKRDLSGNIYWKCKCDCGNTVVVQGRSLRNGRTKSCGCYKKDLWDTHIKEKFIDMTGERYGYLTVIERGKDYVFKGNRHTTTWICRCDCGNTTRTTRTNLITGKAKSCGCKSPRFNEKHGECGTRLYKIWASMKQRCENKNHIYYDSYGGRGISVCQPWQEFQAFYNWAINNGYCDDLTLDRINVNGNYEPSNCRWATEKEQGRNRRDNHFLTFNGETHVISEWSEITGINRETLFSRIRAGRKTEDILTIRPSKRNRINQKHIN